jgi:putative tryptophan/tyrosine transport system substrate-binding protein
MGIKTTVVLLVGLTLASFRFAEAQQPKSIPLVGVLIAGSPSSMATRINAFQQRLRELGYTEGRNLVIEYHYASANYNRLTAIATDLVRSKADVIVTWTTPVTQLVKDVTRTIPVVMAGGCNPVEAGLVRVLLSLAGILLG